MLKPRPLHSREFEPDLQLSGQFFLGRRHGGAHAGEGKLLMAILKEAIHCFQKHALAPQSQDRALFRDTGEWFMEHDTGAAFSFEYICEVLGLDAPSTTR
jgi:hypothetical protein